MLRIARVSPDSAGEELDLAPGDMIIAINGSLIRDLVDWHYCIAAEEVEISLEKASGEKLIFDIEKDYDDDLGLAFDSEPRSCRNNCIFCFIDQQPPGLRDTLYIKDDDFRLSFLQGNYITLTNITQEEIQRIIDERLSPLYLSIHSLDPEVRSRMLGRTRGGDILDVLRLFHTHDINFHGQIVLCPGFNDGPILEQTLEGLLEFSNSLLSLAVVPVGLTQFRQGLPELRPVDFGIAREVITQIDRYRSLFLESSGRSTIYAADEFFLKANLNVPSTAYYEDFSQLENGIGLIRRMLMELECLAENPPLPVEPKTVLLVTGTAAASTVTKLAGKLEQLFPGLKVQVTAVKNSFLGSGITVAGLLSGRDILRHLQDLTPKPDLLVLPEAAVRADKFIDGVFMSDLELALDRQVIAPDNIQDLYDYLKEWM